MSHTGNPRHPDNPPSDPPQEPTGTITKESLAAESQRQHNVGGFDENQANSEAPSYDPATTSGKLARGPNEDSSVADETTTKYPSEAGSVEFKGTHSLDGGYVGGPSSGYGGQRKDEFGTGKASAAGVGAGDSSSGSASGSGESTGVDTAPSYTIPQTSAFPPDDIAQPKGTNLTSDDSFPNKSASLASGQFSGDVGGKSDPGRVAENTFSATNDAVSGGYGDSQTDQGQYTGLKRDESA